MAVRSNTARARSLRTDRTDVEAKLWARLRNRQLDGFKFRRQFPIDRYIVDFACIPAKLVVELDGGQHALEADRDAERTAVIEACGFHVLRFWNPEFNANLEGVLEAIRLALRPASL